MMIENVAESLDRLLIFVKNKKSIEGIMGMLEVVKICVDGIEDRTFYSLLESYKETINKISESSSV